MDICELLAKGTAPRALGTHFGCENIAPKSYWQNAAFMRCQYVRTSQWVVLECDGP